MYDLVTSAVLFFILTPGVVLTLPPGGGILAAALTHAVVFWVVQTFVSQYIPWWGIWILGVAVVGGRFYMGRTPATPTIM